MPINSKSKGKRGELEFCHFLRDLGVDARRGQQFKGSPDSPDVITDLDDVVHFEIKRVEKFNAYNALAQAKNDAGDNQIPVVAHRKNKEAWICVLEAEKLVRLLSNHGKSITADD